MDYKITYEDLLNPNYYGNWYEISNEGLLDSAKKHGKKIAVGLAAAGTLGLGAPKADANSQNVRSNYTVTRQIEAPTEKGAGSRLIDKMSKHKGASLLGLGAAYGALHLAEEDNRRGRSR